MNIGNGRFASLDETKRRIYADGKTNSRPILGNVNWEAENGSKIDSKAFFSAGVLEIPQNGEISTHKHKMREEIYYVLRGIGEATVDGETMTIKPGIALWFPANCEHGIFNPNQEELLLFFATAVIEPGNMKHD